MYMDEAQRKTLERLSRATGKSVGQLVREAVDKVYCAGRIVERPLSKNHPIWRYIGSAESREGDIAARHDHYLYGNDDEDVR